VGIRCGEAGQSVFALCRLRLFLSLYSLILEEILPSGIESQQADRRAQQSRSLAGSSVG
jgi:hypothetical protein